MTRIAIVGAGVVGVSTALSLAELGFDVTVIDQNDDLAQGASGRNGAQLSYNYTDALGSPSTLKQMPKLIAGLDPAFRMRPQIDSDFVRWSMTLLRNSSQAQFEKSTLQLLELALESKQVMHNWLEKYAFEFGHRQVGKLQLHTSTSALEACKKIVQLKNDAGANQRLVSAEEVLELEPAIQLSTVDFAGAVYSPDEEVGDVVRFLDQVSRYLTANKPVRFLMGTEITGINKEGRLVRSLQSSAGELEFDQFIVCAGHASSRLSRKLGLNIPPIIAGTGYSLTYPSIASSPNLSVTDAATKTVFCRLDNSIRIAGMMDIGYSMKELPIRRLRRLQQQVESRFPALADFSGEGDPWMGQRPMTANNQPIIRPAHELSNVFLNTGHGMLGWTLAAASAERLAKIVYDSVN